MVRVRLDGLPIRHHATATVTGDYQAVAAASGPATPTRAGLEDEAFWDQGESLPAIRMNRESDGSH